MLIPGGAHGDLHGRLRERRPGGQGARQIELDQGILVVARGELLGPEPVPPLPFQVGGLRPGRSRCREPSPRPRLADQGGARAAVRRVSNDDLRTQGRRRRGPGVPAHRVGCSADRDHRQARGWCRRSASRSPPRRWPRCSPGSTRRSTVSGSGWRCWWRCSRSRTESCRQRCPNRRCSWGPARRRRCRMRRRPRRLPFPLSNRAR